MNKTLLGNIALLIFSLFFGYNSIEYLNGTINLLTPGFLPLSVSLILGIIAVFKIAKEINGFFK